VFLDLLCLPEMVSVVRRDDAQPIPTRTRLRLKNAVWSVGCSKPFFAGTRCNSTSATPFDAC
jgi:hypothetical protein